MALMSDVTGDRMVLELMNLVDEKMIDVSYNPMGISDLQKEMEKVKRRVERRVVDEEFEQKTKEDENFEMQFICKYF
jgi:hypothetical protein